MTALATTTPVNNQVQRTRAETATLGDMLMRRRDLIAAVIPKHMTPERMIKLATVACARSPKLLKCSGMSVVNAVIKAAELGLDCSGTLGSAYLVPFEQECTLIIGYRGLIDLARRSGQIVSIEAHAVYKNDQFEMSLGTEGKIKHVPTLEGEPGDFRLAYFVCRLVGGGVQTDVMTKAQLDKIRNRSRARKEGPWVTDTIEMYRKTVVKRGLKYCPMSVELAEAIAADDDAPLDLRGMDISDPTAAVNAALRSTEPVNEEDQAGDPPADDGNQTGEGQGEQQNNADDEANRIIEEAAQRTRAAQKQPELDGETVVIPPDFSHVKTWADFDAAMEEVSQAKGIAPSVCTAMLNAIQKRKNWLAPNVAKAEPKFMQEALTMAATDENWDWKKGMLKTPAPTV